MNIVKNIDNISSLKNTTAESKIKNILDIKSLPDDITISTITIVCKFKTQFNKKNIGKYIDLSHDDILFSKFGSEPHEQRSLIEIKKKKKKTTKKKGKHFSNQVSLKIKLNEERNPLDVKIFENGSIQMTGCKSMDDCYDILNKLCIALQKRKAIIDPETNDKIIMKPFATLINNVKLEKIVELKVSMINSKFDIGFKIDRNALYEYLKQNDYYCKLDLDKHASVDIYYNYKNRKTISIFVFEKGNIIITGANTCNHIKEAYNFITEILFENYQQIKLTDECSYGEIMEFIRKSN